MPRRTTPVLESESDSENDENTPVNDENASPHILQSRTYHDTPLRDITDQFFHPPSPSPVRISKRKSVATEPPRRPKKPKSLAYPADPPNWLYSPPSSSLPPSSPLPPSTTNVDHARLSVRHPTPARHTYYLGTPSRTSDSDPFGFLAVERALKAKRALPALAPRESSPHVSAVKSPPHSTVHAHAHAHAPIFASFSQLNPPMPTNNEDIEGLYADEPVSGPSHLHVPVAPLLRMSSDQPLGELDVMHLQQPTFQEPPRTPRKHRHRTSPVLDEDPDPDEPGTDVPSSPSPVKISHTVTRSSHQPVLKLTRAQTKAAGAGRPPTTPVSRTKRVKTSYPHILASSSTRFGASSRQSTAPSTPLAPRRSTRQAAAGARAKLKGASDGEDSDARMKLRPRSTKASKETKPTSRVKHSPSKSKTSPKTRTRKAATAKPVRGRPKGKSSAKNTKGKGKARFLENVLDLSDDTRERYDQERRERLEYFKRLEGYQMQKENLYVV